MAGRIKRNLQCAVAFIFAASVCLQTVPANAQGQYRKADVDAAMSHLSSLDQGERKSACYHLSEMGPDCKDAVPRLIEILQNDPSAGVKGEASNALGKIGPAAAPSVPALIAFLQSKDGGYERTYAASALGSIGSDSDNTIPVLISALQSDEEGVVQRLSAHSLGDFGQRAQTAIPAMINAIKTGDKDLRDAACYGLKHIPANSASIIVLTELLHDEIDAARFAAAKSLAGAGSEAVTAVPSLIALLSDHDADVRSAAAECLGSIGNGAKQALPALKQAAKDSETHRAADEAINLIQKH